MSSSARHSWVGPTLLVAAIGAAAYFGLPAAYKVAKSDPLASYRTSQAEDPNGVGIKLKAVEMEFFEGDRRTGSALINDVQVTRDRQIFTLTGVQKGNYLGKSGEKVEFESSKGVWNRTLGMLTINGQKESPIRVWNAKFNLKTEQAEFAQRSNELRVAGQIQGKFYGGEIKASNLLYRVDSKDYRVGPLAWQGQLKIDEPVKQRTRTWKIEAPGGGESRGDKQIFLKGSATDGEIILKADRLERDVTSGTLIATGNVRYFGKEVALACKKATVYRKERRVIMEGDVSMLIKAQQEQKLEVVEIAPLRPVVPESLASTRPAAPESGDDELIDPKTRRKYPVKVLAQRIEYFYQQGRRRATILGSPQARQELPGGKWRQVWTTEAFYDGEKDTLRLKSAPGQRTTRVKTSRGDDLRTDWFEVSTKEDEDVWKAGSMDFITFTEEDETEGGEPETPAEPPKGGTGGGTGGGVEGPIGRGGVRT